VLFAPFCGHINIEKGDIRKHGKSSWKKICLQGVWCRIYRDPWRRRGTALLREKDGNQEIEL